LGNAGSSVEATLLTGEKAIDTSGNSIKQNSSLEYDFYSVTPANATIHIYSLPTHPLNNNFSNRYGISVDDSPIEVVNFRTTGRSEEWKQNVLRNNAIRQVQAGFLKKGKHTLKIFMVDPGVIIDRIAIDLGGLKKAYSPIPETYIGK
jgi:hypothetical protein